MINHVTPINDLKEHTTESTCECQPRLITENGEMILVHNSFDGREDTEDAEPPRRIRLDLMKPAELAIFLAMQEVEKLPADINLTEAVNLLAKAKDLVSDFIDGISPSPSLSFFYCWHSDVTSDESCNEQCSECKEANFTTTEPTKTPNNENRL